ncbi:PepSY domain-containing protein [Pseudogemmobacter sp. W21_MBD1_M6]|uniref:PepSY domain-containing protein n=1 Tax=Pseudogemmobacter sp. W21_MBD1_M6 TaxID=3240271 RepID=UPI003F9C0995
MLRQLHKFPGLIAGVLVTVLASSGSVLSVFPALERVQTVAQPASPPDVAELAGRVVAHYPGVEQIKRSASGKIVAYYFDKDVPGAVVVDPATGAGLGPVQSSRVERWVTDLHRSLFLDDGGRMVAGAGALAMILLAVSGLQMTARRMGGWRFLLRPARGTGAQRLHVDLGRIAVAGLLLSSVTAFYMVMTTFAIIPDGMSSSPAFPTELNGGATRPVEQIAALQNVALAEFRELSFPYAGDPTDVFTLTTATGEGFIDQATGQMLVWQEFNTAQRVYEFIYMLHTGQGLWWLGLILGVMALGVPVMAATGALVWWARRRARPRIAANVAAHSADTIILVGSEGGSTWGFARTLHDALTALGHKVHTGAMGNIAPDYAAAQRMFILAATYGDGAAPASARDFMARLDGMTAPAFPVAVLGFGDRQFPKFCQFATDIEEALAQKGWAALMPSHRIDRQSAQEFARWGQALSVHLPQPVDLVHVPVLPRSRSLTLLSRSDYGAEVQAPTSIFRFALPGHGLFARLTGRAFPRFAAGDLVGIMAPDSTMPRYYSLASSSCDGVLEICVRKHPGGLCSGHLHGLQQGDRIECFIKSNPDFRPAKGRSPVILIGAGTGVGPLAGFIRNNHKARPMHLYFGGRDPASDFLYRSELYRWLADKNLTTLTTAFSRVAGRAYVQDSLRRDAPHLRDLIAGGAQIMVCGGRDMAQGVRDALAEVLLPVGLDPVTLKAAGRYAEDVY